MGNCCTTANASNAGHKGEKVKRKHAPFVEEDEGQGGADGGVENGDSQESGDDGKNRRNKDGSGKRQVERSKSATVGRKTLVKKGMLANEEVG